MTEQPAALRCRQNAVARRRRVKKVFTFFAVLAAALVPLGGLRAQYAVPPSRLTFPSPTPSPSAPVETAPASEATPTPRTTPKRTPSAKPRDNVLNEKPVRAVEPRTRVPNEQPVRAVEPRPQEKPVLAVAPRAVKEKPVPAVASRAVKEKSAPAVAPRAVKEKPVRAVEPRKEKSARVPGRPLIRRLPAEPASGHAFRPTFDFSESNWATAATIRTWERRWESAIKSHNADAVDKLLANDFTAVSANGRGSTRARLLRDIRNDQNVYKSAQVRDMIVRSHGPDIAVVTGTATEKGTTEKGEEFVSSRRFNDTWRQRKGKWECIASKAVKVAGKKL